MVALSSYSETIGRLVLPFLPTDLDPNLSRITNSSRVFEELSRFVVESEAAVDAGAYDPCISKSTQNATTVVVSLATGARASVVWRLLYRASEHAYSSREFHQKCDGRGPTVTLAKAANGRFAAAYAGVSWNLAPYFARSNPNGFIAQISGDRGLESLVKYSPTTGRPEIWNHALKGPYFSPGFSISDRCNVNEDSYSSTRRVVNERGTGINLFNAARFVVDEFEVYQINLQ